MQATFERNLQEFSTGTLTQAAGALITWACDERRERELLRAAETARPACELLLGQVGNCKAYLDSVAPEPWYRAPEPVDACILRGKAALFNRDKLRESIKVLLSPDGSNVLVVRGDSGRGCSHSLELITHVAAELQTVTVVDLNLPDLGGDAMPDDVMRYLACDINSPLDSIPPMRSQVTRWNLELSRWFKAQVDERDTQTWVVIDGMDAAHTPEETLELIKQLTKVAERSARQLRVVLLECTHALPPDVERTALREELDEIETTTLVEFFTQFFDHQGVPADSEGVEEAVQTVLQLAGDETEGRLQRLSSAALQVAERLSEAPRVA